jgi:hypothetical protein
LEFNLDGTRRRAEEGDNLTPLELCLIEDLILVRSHRAERAARRDDSWLDLAFPQNARLLQASETVVSADWKLVIEQCLESSAVAGNRAAGWSQRSYRRLSGSDPQVDRHSRFVVPNHLIDLRPDGFSILQVLPLVPGRSRLRWHHYTHCRELRPAIAAQYLASRLHPQMSRSMIAVVESTQKGLAIFGDRTAQSTSTPEVAAFRQYLLARLPVMFFDRPPADL